MPGAVFASLGGAVGRPANSAIEAATAPPTMVKRRAVLSRFYGARTTVSLTATLKLVGETSFAFADGENAARAPKKAKI